MVGVSGRNLRWISLQFGWLTPVPTYGWKSPLTTNKRCQLLSLTCNILRGTSCVQLTVLKEVTT